MSEGEGLPIIGKDPEHVKAMRNHVATMDMCRQGHRMSMEGLVSLITEEQNRPEEDGPPNGIYLQLMHVQVALHGLAIDTIVCQFAFLHAMGVPEIPVPEVPTFKPEGVTEQ